MEDSRFAVLVIPEGLRIQEPNRAIETFPVECSVRFVHGSCRENPLPQGLSRRDIPRLSVVSFAGWSPGSAEAPRVVSLRCDRCGLQPRSIDGRMFMSALYRALILQRFSIASAEVTLGPWTFASDVLE